MFRLLQVYPFNLARRILGNDEEALKIYVPGMIDVINMLGEREQDIIERRYKDKMLLKDIGKTYGLSKERVRQLEAMAIRKFRHPNKRNIIMGVSKYKLDEATGEYDKLLNKYNSILIREKLNNIESNGTRVREATEISISDLGLTTRAYNGLILAGKKSLGDIVSMSETELMNLRNLGTKSVNEIINKVEGYGFNLKK